MTSSTASKVKGLAQKVLGKTQSPSSKPNSSSSDWQQRLATILNQRRNVLNFAEYTTSEAHKQRMQEFAKLAPQVFDNPSLTPRSKWFDHPNYRRNSQMPPFHVHFRHEMQNVLAYLDKALQSILGQSSSKNPHQLCKSAFRQFQGCMSGLGGHVSIEEYAWFPVYQNLHPDLNLKFLKEDHGHLHDSEAKVMHALHELMTAAADAQTNDAESKDSLEQQLVATIQLVMDFDQQLLGHLGEEEEVVVPITLAHEGYLPL